MMKNYEFGVIGCGNRINGVLSAIRSLNPEAHVVSVLDIDEAHARECLPKSKSDPEKVRFYSDEKEFFANEKPDAILIGTHCYAHAHYAAEVIRRGIPLFLEKPVGITEEDLALLAPLCDGDPRVTVSFPLRVTPIFRRAKEIMDSGVLGKISQIQAVNNVYYARGYYKKWYRNEALTGGLFLQKATHDVDSILCLLGRNPEKVIGVSTKNIFGGDHPAGLHCNSCAERETCPESTFVLEKFAHEPAQPDTCSFAVDTGNEDSDTMILLFPDGMHAVYTQNFVTRKAAGSRMIRVIGQNATLELEFNSETVKLYHHYSDAVETVKFDIPGSGHHGGDTGLAREFLSMLGGKPVTCGNLKDGVVSARICLRAKESAAAGGMPTDCR